MAVKNLNFLLKQDALPQANRRQRHCVRRPERQRHNSTATIRRPADLTVYFDANRNGNHDRRRANRRVERRSGDARSVFVDDSGRAQEHLFHRCSATDVPTGLFTNPIDGTLDVFAGPGDVVNNINFFLDPPDDAFPPGGSTEPGTSSASFTTTETITACATAGEEGIAGFRVFIDANENGIFESGEARVDHVQQRHLLLCGCRRPA